MIFAIVLFVNSAANFVFGVVLSALLGPAEFGRYATVAPAALTLAAAAFDWLRYSSLRSSGDDEGRARIASSQGRAAPPAFLKRPSREARPAVRTRCGS
jgi:hypothetical protein